MDAFLGFFQGITAEQLMGWFFTALFAFFPGFNLFNKLKEWLKLEDSKANLMVVVVSMLVTGLALFLTGELGLEGLEFTLAKIVEFGLFLYAASQMAYQRFKNAQKLSIPEIE